MNWARTAWPWCFWPHDLKHDRPVALKLLKPEISGHVGSERFSREIRLAARLQHAHICSVYDSGAVEGTGDRYDTGSAPILLYYVSPSSRESRSATG